jgi:hypothetical protein
LFKENLILVQGVDFLTTKVFKEEIREEEEEEKEKTEEIEKEEEEKQGRNIALVAGATLYLVLLYLSSCHNQNYHSCYIPLHQKSHLCIKYCHQANLNMQCFCFYF